MFTFQNVAEVIAKTESVNPNTRNVSYTEFRGVESQRPTTTGSRWPPTQALHHGHAKVFNLTRYIIGEKYITARVFCVGPYTLSEAITVTETQCAAGVCLKIKIRGILQSNIMLATEPPKKSCYNFDLIRR